MALKCGTFLFFLIYGFFTINSANELYETVTNFATKTFREVSIRNIDKNVIISPYAIQRLTMVALQAARGPLYAQMQKALEVECIGDVLTDGLFKRYPNGFHYVDQIFHNVDTTLRIPFILIAKILFNVSPETMDLNNPKLVAKQITSFVEKSSTGLIKNYISPREINKDNYIYFINAVYFEQHWDTPFDKKKSRQGKFYNFGTTETPVRAMYGVMNVNYARLEDLNAQMIELPYRSLDEKLLIVLPNSRTDFKRVQEKVLKSDFPILIKRMRSNYVAITLPPFSVEFRVDLSKVLPQLQMDGLFAPDVDLSNGFDTQPASMVPRIYHKAFFEVNEYGSVVDVPMSNKYKPPSPHHDRDPSSPEKFFLVEHPFLFFLHSNSTIYFAGSIQSINYNAK